MDANTPIIRPVMVKIGNFIPLKWSINFPMNVLATMNAAICNPKAEYLA